jgi:hypothetical protein
LQHIVWQAHSDPDRLLSAKHQFPCIHNIPGLAGALFDSDCWTVPEMSALILSHLLVVVYSKYSKN